MSKEVIKDYSYPHLKRPVKLPEIPREMTDDEIQALWDKYWPLCSKIFSMVFISLYILIRTEFGYPESISGFVKVLRMLSGVGYALGFFVGFPIIIYVWYKTIGLAFLYNPIKSFEAQSTFSRFKHGKSLYLTVCAIIICELLLQLMF